MSYMAFGPAARTFMNPASPASRAANPLYAFPTPTQPAPIPSTIPQVPYYADYRKVQYGKVEPVKIAQGLNPGWMTGVSGQINLPTKSATSDMQPLSTGWNSRPGVLMKPTLTSAEIMNLIKSINLNPQNPLQHYNKTK